MRKDEMLVELSERANIAQFVSFAPGERPAQRHARLRGLGPDHRFASTAAALEAVLQRSEAGSANVRSYELSGLRGRDFVYGLRTVDDLEATVGRLARQGLFTIVNETIDVHDGGVSGVAMGEVLEFAPDATPRVVEEPDVATMPRALGTRLLRAVYGVEPELGYDPGERVEFSLHPLRVGYRHRHTVIWEVGRDDPGGLVPRIDWPNRFSRHIGDKAFGLLVASLLGAPVPAATVVARRVAPFRLGEPTGSGETWIRTCPTEQQPGRFTTARGWRDPFRLLAEEDPKGEVIASVLAQEGVDAAFSGALMPSGDAAGDGGWVVEGVPGYGDRFMQGLQTPVALPDGVVADVRALAEALRATLGPVRMEWVHDGERAWVLQLHRTVERGGDPAVIHPGTPARWRRFDPDQGLDTLRSLIDAVRAGGEGIEVTKRVGLTSHVGDMLRKERVPSRYAR